MSVIPWMVPPVSEDQEVRDVDWFVREPDPKVYHLFQFDEMPKKDVSSSTVSLPPKPSPEPEKKVPKEPEPPSVNKDVERQLGLLAKAIKEIGDAKKQEIGRMSEQVLELGLKVAEELAAGAIEIEPSRILDLIMESLELLGERNECLVRLHPQIFELLEEADLLKELHDDPNVGIVKDKGVEEHGCIVESKMGRVDAQVRERLKKLQHILKDERMGGDSVKEDSP